MKKLYNILLTITVLIIGVPKTKQIELKENVKDILVIDENLFIDKFKVYTSKHEIVNILMPLNAINFNDREDNDTSTTIFFVEADIKDGVKEYKGLSILKNKKATKILKTGTDAAASRDESKTIYIAATDGLFIYEDKIVEKYGPITDSLTGIAKDNGSDIIYILTDKNELYKVTERGTKKELVTEEAKQMVLDYNNNLYFHNDKEPYVYNDGVIKKIEDLPTNVNYISLLKPPFNTEGVPLIINDKTYVVFANGSSGLSEFEFDVKPSAYAMEATLIQYYGYRKSIYEYNILNIIFGGLLPMKEYLVMKGD